MIVRELLARLGMDVDKSSFGKAQDALGRLHLAFNGMKDIVLSVRGAMFELVGAVAENAERLDHAQRITGMSTDHLQELEYAAQRANISTEQLQIGLVHLARTAQGAAQGSGEAAAAFYQLGVQFATSDGKVRPMHELLGDVAERIAKMPDGTKKAALAMEVFGRSGAQLIPILDEGPEGLAKLAKEARALGVVMDSTALASGQRFQAAHERMTAAVQGLKNMIAIQLFPTLTQSTEGFVRMISVHRKWLALKLKEAFEFLTRVLAAVMRAVRGTVDLFERLWQSGSAVRGVLIGVGAAVLALAAPWAVLAGAIALVAEDMELYFSSHGKAKTVTGLLVATFDMLRRKATGIFKDFMLGWQSFKEHPLDFLFEQARAFFKWFIAEAVSIPAKIKAAFASEEGKKTTDGVKGAGQALQRFGDQPGNVVGGLWKLWGRQLEWLGDRLSGVAPGVASGPMPPGLESLLAPSSPAAPALPRSSSAAGSETARGGLGDDLPALAAILRSPDPSVFFAPQAPVLQPSSRSAPAAQSVAPNITFGDVVIHAAPGDNGQKIGDDFVSRVKPQIKEIVEDHWNTKMRETAASVGR